MSIIKRWLSIVYVVLLISQKDYEPIRFFFAFF
ncbi:hypothetical protein ES703_71172 [subsurface metagenome]